MWCCIKPRVVHDAKPDANTYLGCELNQGEVGHIYLIREREFVNTNEPIYKIGKSINIKSRMPSYPKNSVIIAIFHTKRFDVHRIERELISICDKRFKQRKDIGREYYEADVNDLVNEITRMIKKIYSSTT